MRLQQSMGNLFRNRLVTTRTEIPNRTDIDVPVPYRQTCTSGSASRKAGAQEGRCNGCRNEFPFRVLEVDNIIPLGVVARTTSTTCNYCELTATGSNATGLRSTLNQYQGGMCISRVLKTTERTLILQPQISSTSLLDRRRYLTSNHGCFRRHIRCAGT